MDGDGHVGETHFQTMNTVDHRLTQILAVGHKGHDIAENIRKVEEKFKADHIGQEITQKEIDEHEDGEHGHLEHIIEVSIIIIMLASLFFGDAWDYGNLPENQDIIRNVILLVMMAIFFYEVRMLSVGEPGYYMGVFFWIDLVGTFSIIFELTWVIEAISRAAQGISVLRAARVVKLCLKSKEVTKILRKVIDIARSVICVEGILKNMRDKVKKPISAPILGTEPKIPELKGKKVEVMEAMAYRVAAIVMTLILVVPFLSYSPTDDSPVAWISGAAHTARNGASYEDLGAYSEITRSFYDQRDTSLISIKIHSPYVEEAFEQEFHTRKVLREDNIDTYVYSYSILNSVLLSSTNEFAADYVSNPDCLTCSTDFNIKLEMDVTYPHQMDAFFSMMITVLCIIVLQFGTLSLKFIMDQHCFNVISKLIAYVNELTNNEQSVLLRSPESTVADIGHVYTGGSGIQPGML